MYVLVIRTMGYLCVSGQVEVMNFSLSSEVMSDNRVSSGHARAVGVAAEPERHVTGGSV